MKPISLRTVALAAPIVSLFAVINCAPDDPTVPNTGTGGSSTAGTTATPGAGTPSMAGTTATPTAGTTSTAGTASGGTASGGTASGGTASGGTGGAAGGCTDKVKCIDEVASAPSSFGNPGWKDSWWVTGCYKKQQHDCLLMEDSECGAKNDPAGGSEGKGARTRETWKLGGEPGQKYKVSFQFNAVTEAKRYTGGARDVADVAGDPHTNTPLDMFYRGGTSPESNYNVVKLTVFDEMDKPVRNYYMNAAPDGGDLGNFENHYTFLASYKKSIVVIGGGKIEHLVQDKNCHAIDNCGPNLLNGATCAAERKLPGESANLTLPPKYQDPRDGMIKNTQDLAAGPYPRQAPTQAWHSQAGHLKIISIEKTTEAIDAKLPDPT